MIPKIESFCSSYLNGVPEFKAYANQSHGKTVLAALKVFTYIASLAVLPAIALGVRYVCRKLSAPVVPGPVMPGPVPVMPIRPNPRPQAPVAPVKPTLLLTPVCEANHTVFGVVRHLKTIDESVNGALVLQMTKVYITMNDGTMYKLSCVAPMNSNKDIDYERLNIWYFIGVDETQGINHINPEDKATWIRTEIPVANIASASVTTEKAWDGW
jgi:hypothetical protein